MKLGKREQKTFQHPTKDLSQDVDDSDNESISHMSRISSIEDNSLLIKNNDTNENEDTKNSLYFDTKESENEVNEEEDGETIEIISNTVNNENEQEKEYNNDNNNNNNNENDNEMNFDKNEILIDNDLKNDEKKESTNNNNNNGNNNDNDNEYLTKEEIIRKVSNPNKKELKRKKFSTIGPKSSIRFMFDNENESNLKDAMSTTNLDGNNDPSEFLNKKLENHKNDISRKSLSRNFSRMIKNNKNNVFESNMAFVNKTFDEFNDDDSEEMDDEHDDKYSNSNFSIFYDKIKNPNQSSKMLNDDDINNNGNKDEEVMDSNELEDQNNSDLNNEIVEKVFVPLQSMEEQNNSDSHSEIERESLKNKEEGNDQDNENMINNVDKNDSFDGTIELSKHEKEISTDTTVDESIYDNIKEYKPTNERKGSFSDGNKKKLSRKYSKRVPKCISKSSAAAFSMIQFNLENIDVDNVNDSDLDNLDFTKIKALQHENSNISEDNQNQNQDQDQDQNQNQDQSQDQNQDQNQNQNQNQKPILDKLTSEYLSCEDILDDEKATPLSEQNSKQNSEQKLKTIEENSQSNIALNKNKSSSQQSIPKSPAKPAPPPPSYTKVKTRTRPVVEESITDIFENVEGNKTENEENKEILISEEIKNRLESKRKKDHRPDDINKMSYKEILKEKKAIKQELLLLKSVYSNNHQSKNNSISKNNNDFVGKSMLQTIESSMDANNKNSKMDVNSQLPPLHYDNNSDNKIITKKVNK